MVRVKSNFLLVFLLCLLSSSFLRASSSDPLFRCDADEVYQNIFGAIFVRGHPEEYIDSLPRDRKIFIPPSSNISPRSSSWYVDSIVPDHHTGLDLFLRKVLDVTINNVIEGKALKEGGSDTLPFINDNRARIQGSFRSLRENIKGKLVSKFNDLIKKYATAWQSSLEYNKEYQVQSNLLGTLSSEAAPKPGHLLAQALFFEREAEKCRKELCDLTEEWALKNKALKEVYEKIKNSLGEIFQRNPGLRKLCSRDSASYEEFYQRWNPMVSLESLFQSSVDVLQQADASVKEEPQKQIQKEYFNTWRDLLQRVCLEVPLYEERAQLQKLKAFWGSLEGVISKPDLTYQKGSENNSSASSDEENQRTSLTSKSFSEVLKKVTFFSSDRRGELKIHEGKTITSDELTSLKNTYKDHQIVTLILEEDAAVQEKTDSQKPLYNFSSSLPDLAFIIFKWNNWEKETCWSDPQLNAQEIENLLVELAKNPSLERVIFKLFIEDGTHYEYPGTDRYERIWRKQLLDLMKREKIDSCFDDPLPDWKWIRLRPSKSIYSTPLQVTLEWRRKR